MVMRQSHQQKEKNKMSKEQSLMHELRDMIKDTKAGRLDWKLQCQTTEYNDESAKPTIVEDDIKWTVDECYVSYECEYKGETFLMISYEMIHTAGDKKNTTNLIFLPPLGIRYFDINVLMPYAVEADSVLLYEVNQLWLTLLEMHKGHSEHVVLDAGPRELVIE